MIRITATPADQIEKVWPMVRDLVSSAMDRVEDGRFSLGGVHARLADGRCTLFIAFDGETREIMGICGIEIHPYDNLTVAWCAFMAGREMDRWMQQMTEQVEAYARTTGCSVVEGSGRDGWGRAMKAFGYAPADTVVRKEL